MSEIIHAIDCDMGEDCTCNPERFRIFVLCDCPTCSGTGKIEAGGVQSGAVTRCPTCRGEGRGRREVATAPSPEALGVAIVRCGREGEFTDCPVGVLDSEGKTSEKWIIRPWLPSARNVSAAARTLGTFSGEKRRERSGA